jgi:methionyl-tRNA formyltransferase
MALRIAFMGTPDFAVPALDALCQAGHDLAAVYCQPPRPAGRGQRSRPCPVQAWAEDRGIPVQTPVSLKKADAQQVFRDLRLDAAVVAAYGLILPKAILEAPRLGCLNIHASLLPRWRGAAPIHRALLAGDRETGISIMQMDEGLDTGPVLLTERIPITDDMTAAVLHDALSALGARLIVDALQGLADGTLEATPQPEQGVTYAAKLTREEGRLDWTESADALERKVRAFTPWPGAWCEVAGARVKLLAAQVVDGAGDPGAVLDDRLTIACGERALRPSRLQREGRKEMDAETFLRGFPLPKGSRVA